MIVKFLSDHIINIFHYYFIFRYKKHNIDINIKIIKIEKI